MRLFKGKKGFIVKIILFVIVALLVLSAFMSVFTATKNTAESLTKQTLDSYELQAGSFINPSLSLSTFNFWQHQFKDFLESAVKTSPNSMYDSPFASEHAKDHPKECASVFFLDPAYKSIDGWHMNFMQKDDRILVSLEDGSGVLGAYLDSTKDDYSLKDKQLCIKLSDGSIIDTREIIIVLHNDAAQNSLLYYPQDDKNSVQKEIPFDAYKHNLNQVTKQSALFFDFLKKDATKSNLYFFDFIPAKNEEDVDRLCILPVSENGAEKTIAKSKIEESLKNSADTSVKIAHSGGFEDYADFCEFPDFLKKQAACLLTPCATFTQEDGDLAAGAIKYCESFSSRCGGLCMARYDAGRGFLNGVDLFCDSCALYLSCSDLKSDANKRNCEEGLKKCNLPNCKWNADDKKCVSEGG